MTEKETSVTPDQFAALRAWVVARAQEKSTVATVVTALGALAGVTVLPERTEAIATLAWLVSSAIAVATKEAPK